MKKLTLKELIKNGEFKKAGEFMAEERRKMVKKTPPKKVLPEVPIFDMLKTFDGKLPLDY